MHTESYLNTEGSENIPVGILYDFKDVFGRNVHELEECSFYYRDLSSDDAYRMIENEQPGSFLIRDSSCPLHYFTVTYKSILRAVKHIRIAFSQGQYFFRVPSSMTSLQNVCKTSSVIGLVELYIAIAKSPVRNETHVYKRLIS